MGKIHKRKSRLERFLDHRVVNTIISAALPIIIGVLFSMITWEKISEIPYLIYLIVAIVLLLIYICAKIYYFNPTKNGKKTNKETHNKIIHNNIIDDHLKHSSKSIKALKEHIDNKQEVDFGLWSFDIECQNACEEVCQFLSTESSDAHVFVAIIVKIEEQFKVAGFVSAHDRDAPPKYCSKQDLVSFDDIDGNKFIKTFNCKNSVFCFEPKKIKNMYMFDNTIDYTNYYSIPIYNQATQKQVVARMEIVTYNNTKIFKTKPIAEQYYTHHFSSLIKYLEVAYQLEETLLAI